MIKSILLAADGSNASWGAWRYAVDLAQAYQALLRVVTVVDARVPDPESMVPVGSLQVSRSSATATMEDGKQTESSHQILLDEIKLRTQGALVRVETMLEMGVPADVILALEPITDLIALGHRRERSLLDPTFVMGSVADQIVRTSCKPVLVASGNYVPLRRILAAYDASDPSKRALHWAASLGENMRVPVEVVHVTGDSVNGHKRLGEAGEYLEQYAAYGPCVKRHLLHGDAASQILLLAQQREAGLIVMGAHGHHGLREALLGSVTESVLQHLDRAVLMTR
jgi:nucleotide-binding universal stress UspA family protein